MWNSVASLNLIHFLDFYFFLMFFAGTYRRFAQYHSVARLVMSGPARWPKLLELVKQYRTIFWTWSTVMPAIMALILWAVQMIASRLVFPDAGSQEDRLTLAKLCEHWLALAIDVPLGLSMLAFDIYTLCVVGQIDRVQLEGYFDQAEYWLSSKTAHVVRVVTFGRINPRRMVAEEVEKALVMVSGMLNYSLWWTNLQIGLRFAFALALWLTWAMTRE